MRPQNATMKLSCYYRPTRDETQTASSNHRGRVNVPTTGPPRTGAAREDPRTRSVESTNADVRHAPAVRTAQRGVFRSCCCPTRQTARACRAAAPVPASETTWPAQQQSAQASVERAAEPDAGDPPRGV